MCGLIQTIKVTHRTIDSWHDTAFFTKHIHRLVNYYKNRLIETQSNIFNLWRLSEQNKSALTDHASHHNHVINWSAATILDRESDKNTRWIKERYAFGKRDKVLWTGTRAATHSATRTTDFLPRHITIVARTGRGSKQTSSEEGLW